MQGIKPGAHDAQVRNEGMGEIHEVSFYIREPQKDVKTNRRRSEEMRISAEVSGTETREIIKKIIKTVKLGILKTSIQSVKLTNFLKTGAGMKWERSLHAVAIKTKGNTTGNFVLVDFTLTQDRPVLHNPQTPRSQAR